MASPSKKHAILRIDPLVHEALQRWADDEMRSFNAQVEYLLKESLRRAGRKQASPKLEKTGLESAIKDGLDPSDIA